MDSISRSPTEYGLLDGFFHLVLIENNPMKQPVGPPFISNRNEAVLLVIIGLSFSRSWRCRHGLKSSNEKQKRPKDHNQATIHGNLTDPREKFVDTESLGSQLLL